MHKVVLNYYIPSHFLVLQNKQQPFGLCSKYFLQTELLNYSHTSECSRHWLITAWCPKVVGLIPVWDTHVVSSFQLGIFCDSDLLKHMEAVSDNQMDYSWITQLYSHSLQNHSIKPRVSCKLTKDKSNSQSITLTMHHKLQDNRKTTCLGNTGYRDKLWNIPQGIHDWHWQHDCWYGICHSSF